MEENNETRTTLVLSKTDARKVMVNFITDVYNKAVREYGAQLTNPLPQGWNVLKYAANAEANFEANLENNTGKTRNWTWFSDISIAECYGGTGVYDTIKNGIVQWLEVDNDAVAELLLSVNFKAWEAHARKLQGWVGFYSDLYHGLFEAVMDYYENTQQAERASELAQYLD